MDKTKSTYLFERKYDKGNLGVADETLKRYWTSIIGSEATSELRKIYGMDLDAILSRTSTYTINPKNLDEIQQ